MIVRVDKWVVVKIALIKVLYLYIFNDFCWKKMLDTDFQSWIYFFTGHPVETSLFNCSANQWTGFYMMAILAFNELKQEQVTICLVWSGICSKRLCRIIDTKKAQNDTKENIRNFEGKSFPSRTGTITRSKSGKTCILYCKKGKINLELSTLHDIIITK